MKFSSSLLEEAVNAFSKLPGVGRKSALRMVLHLLKDQTQKSEKIIQSLLDVNAKLKTCKKCYNYSDEEVCNICLDEHRLKNVLCVVESIRDVMAIEETQQYSGRYHILGGVISPLEGLGPDDLNIDQLCQRVDNEKIEEIIMAVSPSIEGETTIFYISKKLESKNVNISMIARGVSFGGDLEYADELTLGRSIQSRTPYVQT